MPGVDKAGDMVALIRTGIVNYSKLLTGGLHNVKQTQALTKTKHKKIGNLRTCVGFLKGICL